MTMIRRRSIVEAQPRLRRPRQPLSVYTRGPARRRRRRLTSAPAARSLPRVRQDPVTKGRRGPVKTEELQVLQRSGEITARCLVWTKGMAAWARLEKAGPLSPGARGAPAATASGAAPGEREYYYVDGQKETRGPLRSAELRRLLEAGSISIDTKLWSPGQKEYVPASSALPGLHGPGARAAKAAPGRLQVPGSRSPSEASAQTPGSAGRIAGSDVVSSFDGGGAGASAGGGAAAEQRRRSEEFEHAFATAYGDTVDDGRGAAASEDGEGDETDGAEVEGGGELEALREKVKHLELELASVNVEAMHMKDMIESRGDASTGADITVRDVRLSGDFVDAARALLPGQPCLTRSFARSPVDRLRALRRAQTGEGDPNVFAELAGMYNRHFEVLGHRQRLLEQFSIVVDHQDR